MTEAPEPNRLFLLDGMALVYRAHFALIRNPIMNSKGINTSALYGFTNTLLSIIQNEKPTHLAVAWDTSAPTPRHEKYPAYKANRDEMPDELRTAIPACKELCRAFAIPLLEIDGYEADDLIGTLAKTADDKGDFHTFMVTPDKDFAQLISPRATMWKPGRKGSEYEAITVEKIPEVWGVSEPHQIIDLLGLMGDSADNIPGVPGIGPKTAVKLIAQFGSVEKLLANTDQLKGKQKENVENNKENAILSKDLATIMRDAPLQVSFDDLVLSPYNEEAIQKLFAEYEFRSLAKRLFGEKALPPTPASDSSGPEEDSLAPLRTIAETKPTYQLVNSPALEKELFAALEGASSYCFDLETTSLNRFESDILGIAFALETGTAYYLPYNRVHHPRLKALFAQPAEKIGHNLKFDLHILRSHGIEVRGPFFDTMLVHALLYPEQRHTMDRLAENLLRYQTIKLADLAAEATAAAEAVAAAKEAKDAQDAETAPAEDDLFSLAASKAAPQKKAAAKKSAKAKAKAALDMKAIPLEALAQYAAEDADITLQLAHLLRPLLEKNELSEVYQNIEAPLLPVLVQMEAEGITLDPKLLAEVGEELTTRIEHLSTEIIAVAGQEFNLNSPKQLGEILFEKLKLIDKPKKTKTGQYSTNEQTLSLLAIEHPIAANILLYRQASKLKSTYVDALPDDISPHDGRIHTHLHQHIAATGRLASSDPNLQNIPVRSELGREIRKAFVPRQDGPFTLFAADYSQIELRIMAALSGDPSMIEAFQNDRDIHTETAAKVYGVSSSEVTSDHRRTAKMVNFGIIYGISAFGLAQRLSIPRAEATEIIQAYWKQYPKIKDFMNATIESAKEKGYTETISGRRRYFPEINSGNGTVRANAERAAINTPIQGTAADMIKLAMINTAQLLAEQKTTSKMLLQVHDELLFDLHESEAATLPPQLIATMENALTLPNDVPVKVETGTGTTWLEAH